MDAIFLFGCRLNVFGDQEEGGYDAKALELAVGDFPLRGFLVRCPFLNDIPWLIREE